MNIGDRVIVEKESKALPFLLDKVGTVTRINRHWDKPYQVIIDEEYNNKSRKGTYYFYRHQLKRLKKEQRKGETHMNTERKINKELEKKLGLNSKMIPEPLNIIECKEDESKLSYTLYNYNKTIKEKDIICVKLYGKGQFIVARVTEVKNLSNDNTIHGEVVSKINISQYKKRQKLKENYNKEAEKLLNNIKDMKY